MKDKKILVADRSQSCNQILGYYFKHLGVDQENVTMVNDGNEALEATKKELFDIIILSPHKLGMDATELAIQIKSQYKENPPKIIEYTSGALGHEHKKVFDNVIFKPTTEENFVEKIWETLGAIQ